MSDADRVEAIRLTPHATNKLCREREVFLLAQYDALKAENGKLRELIAEARSCLVNADCHKKAFGIGGDGETHWYLVDELVARLLEVL